MFYWTHIPNQTVIAIWPNRKPGRLQNVEFDLIFDDRQHRPLDCLAPWATHITGSITPASECNDNDGRHCAPTFLLGVDCTVKRDWKQGRVTVVAVVGHDPQRQPSDKARARLQISYFRPLSLICRSAHEPSTNKGYKA
jgi:hypothetical protein